CALPIFPGVARGRIAGKPGGDDELGSRAQQLDSGLVADLNPPSRQQRHPPRQVSQLSAFGKVELGARWAQLIVEVVQSGEGLLADVAVLGVEAFFRCAAV